MITSFLLKIIRFYQKYLSIPLFGRNTCRFSPTCSEYTYQSIAKYGILRGITMGLVQILKCNPFYH
ncbi:MAG: membrane protein insertion efficiency factor YidD [Patescibacteria group bacterium]